MNNHQNEYAAARLALATLAAALLTPPAAAGSLADSPYTMPAQAVKAVSSSNKEIADMTADNSRLAKAILAADKLPAGRGFIEKFNGYNQLLANYEAMDQSLAAIDAGFEEIIGTLRLHAADKKDVAYVNGIIARTHEEVRTDEIRQEEFMAALEKAGDKPNDEDLSDAADEIEFFKIRKATIADYKAVAAQIAEGKRQEGSEVRRLELARELYRLKRSILSAEKHLIANQKQKVGFCASEAVMFGRTSCGGRKLKRFDIIPPDPGIDRLRGSGNRVSGNEAGKAAIRAMLEARRKAAGR